MVDQRVRPNITTTVSVSANKHFDRIGVLRTDSETKSYGTYLAFIKNESQAFVKQYISPKSLA